MNLGKLAYVEDLRTIWKHEEKTYHIQHVNSKVELKRTLLTLVLATNRATTVNSLRPKKVA